MDKPKCSTCKFLKGDLWDEAECLKCLPPLMEENEDAVGIYYLVQDQFIMGFNGPVALNHIAIHEAMRLYKIHDKKDCFEKVLRLAAYFVEKVNRKIEENRKTRGKN